MELERITSPGLISLADLGEFVQIYPAINRLILRHLGASIWEIIKQDGERPTDLSYVAERCSNDFGYERNTNQGFEALSGYDIYSDKPAMVIYRL
ncbi:MAG: hypothetical protein ACTHJ1_05270 [Bordetella sp.]|uniref:hypothetical protein n=1 Tax=Bordetella sp. TaxID=28081 RepID=UPI003F7BE9D0